MAECNFYISGDGHILLKFTLGGENCLRRFLMSRALFTKRRKQFKEHALAHSEICRIST